MARIALHLGAGRVRTAGARGDGPATALTRLNDPSMGRKSTSLCRRAEASIYVSQIGPSAGRVRQIGPSTCLRLFFPRLGGQRRQEAGVGFGGFEEVGAADLFAQGVGRAGVEAKVVLVAGAEALVVD